MRAWVVLLAFGASCAPVRRDLVVERNEIEHRIERSKNKVFQGALRQLKNPAHYDAAYCSIPYPNGDVPADRGACADVVVRALRHAGIDLQAAIHRDAFKAPYPAIRQIDSNIDHRRVLNQEVWLKRHAQSLTLSTDATNEWRAGDIVSWRLANGQHIGVISDIRRPDGVPFVIHNIGVVAEEDVLTRWRIVGHYRLG